MHVGRHLTRGGVLLLPAADSLIVTVSRRETTKRLTSNSSPYVGHSARAFPRLLV